MTTQTGRTEVRARAEAAEDRISTHQDDSCASLCCDCFLTQLWISFVAAILWFAARIDNSNYAPLPLKQIAIFKSAQFAVKLGLVLLLHNITHEFQDTFNYLINLITLIGVVDCAVLTRARWTTFKTKNVELVVKLIDHAVCALLKHTKFQPCSDSHKC